MSALALVAAFVLLPRPVATVLSGRGYGGEQRLVEQVSSAFVTRYPEGSSAALRMIVGDLRSRGLFGTLTAGALVVAASLAVLGFANLTTALDPPRQCSTSPAGRREPPPGPAGAGAVGRGLTLTQGRGCTLPA